MYRAIPSVAAAKPDIIIVFIMRLRMSLLCTWSTMIKASDMFNIYPTNLRNKLGLIDVLLVPKTKDKIDNRINMMIGIWAGVETRGRRFDFKRCMKKTK